MKTCPEHNKLIVFSHNKCFDCKWGNKPAFSPNGLQTFVTENYIPLHKHRKIVRILNDKINKLKEKL